jgi:hypothetical protein
MVDFGGADLSRAQKQRTQKKGDDGSACGLCKRHVEEPPGNWPKTITAAVAAAADDWFGCAKTTDLGYREVPGTGANLSQKQSLHLFYYFTISYKKIKLRNRGGAEHREAEMSGL